MMKLDEAQTTIMIHNLEIVQREVSIEGPLQQSAIIKLFIPDIPLLIADLQELNEYRRSVHAKSTN